MMFRVVIGMVIEEIIVEILMEAGMAPKMTDISVEMVEAVVGNKAVEGAMVVTMGLTM